MLPNNDFYYNLKTPKSYSPDYIDFDLNEVLQQGQVECGDSSNIIDMDTEVNTSTEPRISDNQVSSNVTTNISETTYTLRREKVPGDGSCLYWSFRYAMSLLSLTVQDLRNQVADYIFNRKDIFDVDILLLPTKYKSRQQYCDGIRKHEWSGHPEFEALSQIYHIMIKVIILRKDQQQNSSIDMIPFANNIISTIQHVATNETHEFRVGELPGDDQSLYASVAFQLDRSKMINVKCLRKNVADVIRSHTDTDDIHVPSSSDYQNREDYRLMVAAGIISGSEPERNGLSYLYPDTLFCIISKPNKNNNAPCIDTYVRDVSSYKKCIIILYDEASDIFKPLYLYNKVNHEEEKTNLKYDDTVKNLLRKFIQNKLKYRGYVNFDGEKDSHAMDSPSHVQHESTDLAEMIAENPSKNESKEQNMNKRKAPEKTQLLTSSRPLPPNDQISTSHEENDISEDIETLLQTDMLAPYDTTITNMMEEQQQQIEDLLSTLSTNTSVADDDERMRFETDPIKIFRGRALSDYVPKSETKRDGTKAKPRKPSYFPDCNNEHHLNLLIPTRYLFAGPSRVWVEIALVTRTINGCIYFNPLFEFYQYNNDGSFETCNPMFIKLGDVETYPLTKYTDELQKLILFDYHIFEQSQKQPMVPFPSLSSNGQTQVVEYKAHDTFKNAFQLNDVRFAITLYTQGPNDQEHQRRLDIQYISPISTQDKKVKLYE
ncbi:unnamed protein product [Adineta steineri]|uniref:Ubiquitin thioesterase OTU n=1 Tax=Adineta steineri TaxID=433720 RepID=A0A814HHV3_9BILA|nr:unnamed protein product [Adineta steineri]